MENAMTTNVTVTNEQIKRDYMRLVRENAQQAAKIEILEMRVARLQEHRNRTLKHRLDILSGKVESRRREVWEGRIVGFFTALYITGLVRVAIGLLA